MDGTSFDKLARYVATETSRRELLGAAGASALGAFGLASLLGVGEAEAKKGGRKRKRRRRRCKPKPAGAVCETSKDCCTKKTKRICGPPNFGGGPNVCCGELGTPCEFDNDCCFGFGCSSGECAEGK